MSFVISAISLATCTVIHVAKLLLFFASQLPLAEAL